MPRINLGFRTVCLHPSTIDEAELRRFDMDIARQRESVIDVRALQPSAIRSRGGGSRLFAVAFSGYFHAKEAAARLLS